MTTDDLLTTDACTLPTLERSLRLAEFDGLFARHLTGSSWAGDRLRLELAGDADLHERVADLTARESACCSFFDFRISGAADAVVLDVGVPPERGDLLASLANLAERAAR
ncbi:hypothetical protein [Nocardioides halotolerans]|uniref:hypothetical protein n=1 Tax=Nocardioides halotolerans TaxID=433660 RepID=UPI00042781B2|nr:hypothetical protein [Nocardioides halotolerans]